jgi:diguanylate cyclase (GGDEF)-like protein
VVPRARDYSRFAAQVAKGSTGARVEPAGRDELTDLGVRLNEMVSHRESEQRRIDQQAEFSEAMQITESEREGYELLKRHLERSVAAACVTVLSRNNSADRLEPRTPIGANDALVERLQNAKPRSCMAVRTGEQQSHREGREPLLECDVCGGLGPSACQPLLVGGEVMGSVLALPDRSLDDEEREAMRVSVAQAAPILANLRNLAIAEQRAGTDALTGLSNQRAAGDAIKRLAADATRSGQPLGAIVLDLDHFKQVNDKFGHAAGDEVLAAVGVTLRTTLHQTDFCARWGGEEFLILLPDTHAQGTHTAAEKIRAAIARTTVSAVPGPISASLGAAVLPLHAIDADGLVRSADRALYMAKAAGRNRVEMVQASEPNGDRQAATTDAGPATSTAPSS